MSLYLRNIFIVPNICETCISVRFCFLIMNMLALFVYKHLLSSSIIISFRVLHVVRHVVSFIVLTAIKLPSNHIFFNIAYNHLQASPSLSFIIIKLPYNKLRNRISRISHINAFLSNSTLMWDITCFS